MDIRVRIRQVLKEQYGEFDSHLEHVYEEKVIENLTSNNLNIQKRWLTYTQVLIELKNNIKNALKVRELLYEITDNTNPNEVCIKIIDSINDKTPELERLYHKIKNF